MADWKRNHGWLRLLVIGIAITALAIGAIALRYLETRLIEATGQTLALAAVDIADKLDRILAERYTHIQLLSQASVFKTPDAKTMTARLSSIKATYPAYLCLYVADSTGTVLAATEPALRGKNTGGRPGFQAARAGQAVSWEDAHVSHECGGALAVSFAAPIRGMAGQWLGVLYAEVDLQSLEDVFSKTALALEILRGSGSKIEWQFVTGDGMVIVDSILREQGKINLKNHGVHSVSRLESGRPGYVEENHTRRHVPVLTGYAKTAGYGRFAGLQWGVLIRIDRGEILAPIRSIIWKLGAAGIAVWLPMLALLLWATRRVRTEFLQAQQEEARAKTAEATLREREEHTGMIFETALDALIVMNGDGRITDWNPQAEKIFGWNRQEATGSLLSARIIPSQYREAHERGLKRFLETGEGPVLKKRIEITACDREGREFPVELAISAPARVGQGYVFSAFLRDISERKQTEEAVAAYARELEHKNRELDAALLEAQAATRAKSEFLATMSHEIRTPMNGVIGMTGLLLETDLAPEQREYADIVRRSGEALLGIINDILDFSKIEARKLVLEKIDFDLRTTVEDVLNVFVETTRQKGLELGCLMYADVPSAVRGDPGRVRQILINLVGNAVKFTQQGEVLVRVSCEADTPEALVAKFEVIDTGVGIPPEAQARLFKAFSQVDGSTTRQYGGTGLGLAISKELVELMGGRVGVTSAPGQGSNFWFTIHLAKQRDGKETDAHPYVDMQGRRVCIVDDNATNRQILEIHAAKWGLQSVSAADAEQALSILRDRAAAAAPCEVAILDLQMPKMDGLQLARAIKADPALATTRLILLTSVGLRGDAEAARQAGISAYLVKPVRQSQLYDCLMTVLGFTGADASRAPADTPARPFVTRHSLKEATATERLRVLVVEDNLVNQKVAVRMLDTLGYQVDIAVNGREAVEAVSKAPYAAVLMDCQMPEMDGWEATRRIRDGERLATRGDGHETESRSFPSASRLPIIAMTADAMEGDRKKCLDAGMDDYLSKPVKREALHAMLDRWIGRAPVGRLPEAEAAASPQPDGMHDGLDPKVLAELRQLDRQDALLATLITHFLEGTPRSLAALAAAFAGRDAAAFQRAAHELLGSCGNLGVQGMRRICAQLQACGKTGNWDGARPLLTALDTEFGRMQPRLLAERSRARDAQGDGT